MIVCAATSMYVLVIAGASDLEAQERGRVRAVAGVTIAPAESGALFGAGITVAVRPWLQIGGEIGRAATMMSRDYQRTVDELTQGFAFPTLDLRIPTVYVLAGPRLVLPELAGAFRPFVDVGIGASRLKLDFSATSFGEDVTALITDPDGNPIDLSDYRETVLVIAAGGGVTASIVEALGIEVAYRYHSNMTDFLDAQHVNTLSVGLTVGF
jgi:hypothetical protein